MKNRFKANILFATLVFGLIAPIASVKAEISNPVRQELSQSFGEFTKAYAISSLWNKTGGAVVRLGKANLIGTGKFMASTFWGMEEGAERYASEILRALSKNQEFYLGMAVGASALAATAGLGYFAYHKLMANRTRATASGTGRSVRVTAFS